MTSKPFMRASLFAAFLCLSVAWEPISFIQDANAQDARTQDARVQNGGRASLPDLTPEQIVEDVKITFNNRAGTQEYAAPTFDPFENNNDIAGSASLRTVTRAISIDGQDLQDGAVLDLAFYYNQIGNNSHADRGFETVVFLSGSKADNIKRDSRALECAADVRQTVFDQNFHSNAGFFHPYGHYSGHRRFGHRSFGGRSYRHNRGFGHSGFGRGFGGGSFGHNRFGGWRRGHSGFGNRNRGFGNRGRNRGRSGFNDNNDRNTRSGGISREEAKSKNGRVNGEPIKENRFNNTQGGQVEPRGQNNNAQNGNAQNGNRPRRNARGNNPDRRRTDRSNNDQNNAQINQNSGRNVITPNSGINAGPKSRTRVATQPTRQRGSQPNTQANPQSNQAQSAPRTNPAPQTQTPTRSVPRSNNRNGNSSNGNRTRSNENRSRSNQSRPARSRPKVPKRTQPRRVPKRSVPRRRNQIIKPKSFNFFPNDFGNGFGRGGREVITSVNTDCTREELLSVHIPADRLEAARFDGLTVLAIDRQGQELPVFIPANYIEGLRLATSGQYDSRLMRLEGQPPLSAPQSQQRNQQQQRQSFPQQQSVPSRATPNGLIASCPAGTVYQSNNGTCLLNPNGASDTPSGNPVQRYPQQ